MITEADLSGRPGQAHRGTAWLGEDQSPKDAKYTSEMLLALYIQNGCSQVAYTSRSWTTIPSKDEVSWAA